MTDYNDPDPPADFEGPIAVPLPGVRQYVAPAMATIREIFQSGFAHDRFKIAPIGDAVSVVVRTRPDSVVFQFPYRGAKVKARLIGNIWKDGEIVEFVVTDERIVVKIDGVPDVSLEMV